jgi:hypothetical protein
MTTSSVKVSRHLSKAGMDSPTNFYNCPSFSFTTNLSGNYDIHAVDNMMRVTLNTKTPTPKPTD